MGGGVYYPLAGIAMCIPFVFLISLGYRGLGCKLTLAWAVEPCTIQVFTAVAFYNHYPYIEATYMAALATITTTATFVLVCILHEAGLIPTTGLSPVEKFTFATADLYSAVVDSATSKATQKSLSAASTQFDMAFHALIASNLPVELQGSAWKIASLLLSLRRTLNENPLTGASVACWWNPIAGQVNQLRCSTVAALRSASPNPKCREIEDDANMDDLEILGKSLRKRVSEIEHKSAGRQVSNELVRFESIMAALIDLAYEVSEFCKSNRECQKNSQRRSDKSVSIPKRIQQWCRDEVDSFVHWWKAPLFADIKEGLSVRDRLLFVLRVSICISIAAVVMVIISWYSPIAKTYFTYLLAPLYMCNLPTAGATLLKGTRRIIGTFAGCVLVVACTAANPHILQAWILELWIISYIGILVSLNPKFGYAGLLFILAWVSVGFNNGVYTNDRPEEMFLTAAWRMGLTLGGVIAVDLASLVIFPQFASAQLRDISARAIREAANSVSYAIALVTDPDEDSLDKALHGRQQLGPKIFKYSSKRNALRGDALAEVAVYGKLHMVPVNCKKILENHWKITQMTSTAVVLYDALVAAAQTEHAEVQNVLVSVRPAMLKMLVALNTSASRIYDDLAHDKVKQPVSISPDEDVNLVMQQCSEVFHDACDKLLAHESSSDEIGYCLRVEIIQMLYALSLFVEDWTALEESLLDIAPVTEMNSS
ncbi:hypothetical protein FOL47_000294 [Perkinsus chesapeaki]|uniref:Aluminum-activated malate transporter 1 n=1 Tax=Perkinsus chesapeaki TaxID=330153 RepID=A0A7J6KW80_PERCH|nr:hypothetical protein FOL47_000294 [Perkinsus chesapeaki]